MRFGIAKIFARPAWAPAAIFFRRSGKIIRRVLLPALGSLLMIGLFVGQIIENTDPPYSWMP